MQTVSVIAFPTASDFKMYDSTKNILDSPIQKRAKKYRGGILAIEEADVQSIFYHRSCWRYGAEESDTDLFSARRIRYNGRFRSRSAPFCPASHLILA